MLNSMPKIILGEPLMDAYQQWRDWADPKVCCDYSFHMCVTYWNDSVAEQMQQVCRPVEEGGAGINSFKMFMVSYIQRKFALLDHQMFHGSTVELLIYFKALHG